LGKVCALFKDSVEGRQDSALVDVSIIENAIGVPEGTICNWLRSRTVPYVPSSGFGGQAYGGEHQRILFRTHQYLNSPAFSSMSSRSALASVPFTRIRPVRGSMYSGGISEPPPSRPSGRGAAHRVEWSCDCQRFCRRAEVFACFLGDMTFAVGTITLCTGITLGCPGSIPSC